MPAAGLPLYAARWVEETVRLAGRGVRLDRWWGRWRMRRVWRLVQAGLDRLGLGEYAVCVRLQTAGPPSAVGGSRAEEVPAGAEEAQRVTALLAGRILLETELAAAARAVGISAERLRAVADSLAEQGSLLRTAAVEVGPGGPICRRCGSREGIVPDLCGSCGAASCPRCTRCASMGVARGCLALYAMEGRVVDGEPGAFTRGSWSLRPGFAQALTPAQKRAFEALRAAVQAHLQQPHLEGGTEAGRAGRGGGSGPGGRDSLSGALLWAVTGAGKTEVAFGAAEMALQSGGSVLFCVPRRAVATEVAARCRQAFAAGHVHLLVGGQAEGFGERLPTWPVTGSLVVATTHQALRFYRAFALVIVDEVDAFPFRGSAMLEQAVERAVRADGFVVVMSATPGKIWMDRARRWGWGVLTIPVRHHGYPVPVPQVWCHPGMARWQERAHDPARVPGALRRWLAQRPPGGRVLMFCPTVLLAEQVARALGVPSCHSRDPRRQEKLAEFAEGRIPVLVCTTLLERGVTFEGLDVAVLFADAEAVFDEAALIQMAGRVGRSARRPWGRVLFAAARMTPSMRRAVEAIDAMNREAARLGLLRGERAGPGGADHGPVAAEVV